MNVLVFNVGSTTLKYALIDSETGEQLSHGIFDRIGQPGGDCADHVAAATRVLKVIDLEKVDAIGHRIVHGGERFDQPAVVDDSVMKDLAELDSLAPLHNPHARRVIEGLLDCGVPQTLVFDTSFFATLSPAAYRYAVPEALYRDYHVRRYGFHGTSHQWITRLAIDHLSSTVDEETASDYASNLKIISLHLGGGCSVTASIGGVAVDTSMGMTPLEGLVMASRCGDIDPAIVLHLMRRCGMTVDEVDTLMNKQSGLLGVCGESDMRAVLKRKADGDPSATLAIDLYVRKIIKTIGGFTAILGGLDAIVFSAGVGEHSCDIRKWVTEPLRHFGVELDNAENESTSDCGVVHDLSRAQSRVRVLTIATNEELAIARQVKIHRVKINRATE